MISVDVRVKINVKNADSNNNNNNFFVYRLTPLRTYANFNYDATV